jgi:hypothetical protein
MKDRIVTLCFIRQCTVGDTEDANHDRHPEDSRAAFRDLEAEEQFRVEECCQSQHTSKCTADESHKPTELVSLVFGKLFEILDGEWIGLTYATLEEMVKFVELANLPLCERCESAKTDASRIPRELCVVTEEVDDGESEHIPRCEENANKGSKTETAAQAVNEHFTILDIQSEGSRCTLFVKDEVGEAEVNAPLEGLRVEESAAKKWDGERNKAT